MKNTLGMGQMHASKEGECSGKIVALRHLKVYSSALTTAS